MDRGFSAISASTPVAEIVANHYRTAQVFRKYGIEYCCGGKWPLEIACMSTGINVEKLISELNLAIRTNRLPGSQPYENWSLEFLTQHITRIHHYYLREIIPDLGRELNRFTESHHQKYPELVVIRSGFGLLEKKILPHLQEEEDVVFPYICQLEHAYESQESYGGLLVKTLRKPVERMMHDDHEMIGERLLQFRQLTNHYTIPEKACTNHKVVFSRLKELDTDLEQHIYMENEILFPRALAMEKKLMEGV